MKAELSYIVFPLCDLWNMNLIQLQKDSLTNICRKCRFTSIPILCFALKWGMSPQIDSMECPWI